MSKLVLGTAQFGMDYGINNRQGKIPRAEVFEILSESLSYGIDILDTAYSYGDSEVLIGEYIKKTNNAFKVISKLPQCGLKETKEIFMSSLKRISLDKIYGCLIHNFKIYSQTPELLDVLRALKSQGKIEKIGLSLYYPSEAEIILKHKVDIDIIQVPYSIFDQRFAAYFPELNRSGIEIYARSVFLQGLVFIKPEDLENDFTKIRDKSRNLHLLSLQSGVPLVALCLNFACIHDLINKVIIGVDSIHHFREIVSSLDYLDEVKKIQMSLSDFKEDDENIILPINWKVGRG